ncbi:hypothetical protein Goshw_014816, partial [Gossypium schwendimanii]|nr:hypothetical protein [Gossypium schwendimanii]
VVAFLGVLSAATGFAAEATRIKASEVKFVSTTQCSYPRSPALGLGLTAAAALLIRISHWSEVKVGLLVSPGEDISGFLAFWLLLLIMNQMLIPYLCRFTFVIAFLLLLTGSALNDQHGEESVYFGNYYCYVVKPGVFAGGAVLAIASVVFGIFYYLTLNTAKNTSDPWGNSAVPNQGGGIAMGQPQFPTQTSQDPVFVHEDTYNRRQFT